MQAHVPHDMFCGAGEGRLSGLRWRAGCGEKTKSVKDEIIPRDGALIVEAGGRLRHLLATMIHSIMIFNNHGKPRMLKFYKPSVRHGSVDDGGRFCSHLRPSLWICSRRCSEKHFN